MAVSRGRIKFAGNPWRGGHGIKVARWTGLLTSEGLRFHLHLESDAYDKEDDREDDELDDDWKSRVVWTNYGGCTLSSTKWEDSGFLVATTEAPIDLRRLEGKTLRVDRFAGKEIPEDADLDECSFGIYLLGHDTAIDHRIRFVKKRGPATYDVRWRARIALTYTGDRELAHQLDATLTKLKLDHIALEPGMKPKDARELLSAVLVDSRGYQLRGRKFVLGSKAGS
jgi:hypothetical protein